VHSAGVFIDYIRFEAMCKRFPIRPAMLSGLDRQEASFFHP